VTPFLKSTGKFVVGDETLLHFTGDSTNIRLIPTTPDRIGLWFFVLVCMLDEQTPYLLRARLQNSVAALGEKIPVNAMVKDWSKVVLHYKVKNKASGPILVFDSYYNDSEGRKYMNESGVRYIGACNSARFGLLVDILRKISTNPVDKPGLSSGIHNPNSQETFIHHWDKQTDVGKKLS
jgi:hypothetical protein